MDIFEFRENKRRAAQDMISEIRQADLSLPLRLTLAVLVPLAAIVYMAMCLTLKVAWRMLGCLFCFDFRSVLLLPCFLVYVVLDLSVMFIWVGTQIVRKNP